MDSKIHENSLSVQRLESNLKDKFENFQEMISKLEENARATEQRLSQQLSELKSQLNNEMNSTVQSLSSSLSSLKEDFSHVNPQINSLESSLKKEIEEIRAEAASIHTLKESLERMQATLLHQEEVTNQTLRQFDEKLEKLSQQSANIENEVSLQMGDALKEIKLSNEESVINLQEKLQTIMKSLSSKCEANQRDLSSYTSQLTQLAGDFGHTVSQLSDLSHKLSSIEHEVQETQKWLSSKNKALEGLSILRESVESIWSSLAVLSGKITEAEAKIDTFR